MGSSPITATIRRDSKGSPCAPLKPATSGCDPWSRHQSRVSSKGRASVFQTDDASVRVRLPAPILLAASNQGECAALLRRNELGSIPRLPANYRRVLANNADSKPAKESSILLRRCQQDACGVSQVGQARSCNLRERGSIPRPYSMAVFVQWLGRRSVTASTSVQFRYIAPRPVSSSGRTVAL